VTVDDLARFHERKFRQALENRPDAVAFETVPSLLECEAISGLLLAESEPSTRPAPTEGSVGRGAPPACWVSLACRNGDELNDGTPVSAALDALLRVPPDRLQGIGFNCCDSRCLPTLVEHFLACEAGHSPGGAGRTPRRALALYPNSGEAWDAGASRWVPGTGHAGAADFCDQLWACVDLVIGKHRAAAAAAGPDPPPPLVLVLGGCCRTSLSSIAALRKRVDEYLGRKR
jgi:homocysteine S-methyltransferase